MNLSTENLQTLDAQHHLHPFTDTRALVKVGCKIVTRADGVYIWDSEDRKLLDGMAGLWCVNVGYGRKELADVAYQQLLELPYYNNFFNSSHPSAISLSSLLAEVTPAHMNHVFFTNSGSEANDTVIRLVRRYWDLAGKPGKKAIISRHDAYHGSTIGSASLGGMKEMHEQGHLPIPNIEHIDPPYWYRDGGDLSRDEFGLKAAGYLEEKILELGPDNVAAFIGEPVQGAGGVIIPPDTYWPEIQRICREHDILLIADEVICGFGRLGSWFGSDHFNIKPDLMPIAKGLSSGYLPIGGVMIGDRVAKMLIDKGEEFAHGFTYSGHPASCAVAIANINIIKDEGLVEKVHDDTGPYLQQHWQKLAEHPLVGEARGIGFIGALELAKDKANREFFDKDLGVGALCRDFCIENGLVMRAVGDTMIISPPLTMQKANIDELFEAAGKSLDQTAEKLGIK